MATAVLSRERTPCRQHPFPQPQLLAVLCLMRYEDWTFREAEVRWREPAAWRRVWGLRRVPDYTTLYRVLQRREEETIPPAVRAIAPRFPATGRSRRRGGRRERAAPSWCGDGIIIRTSRCPGDTGGSGSRWWIGIGSSSWPNARGGARGTIVPPCRPWWRPPTRLLPMGVALAAAEFDRERHPTYIRQTLRARSVIPAQRGQKTGRIRGVRAERRAAFPRQQYRRRARIETVFSTVKRQLSARAPGRSLFIQWRQALLLGLAYNLYRL